MQHFTLQRKASPGENGFTGWKLEKYSETERKKERIGEKYENIGKWKRYSFNNANKMFDLCDIYAPLILRANKLIDST